MISKVIEGCKFYKPKITSIHTSLKKKKDVQMERWTTTILCSRWVPEVFFSEEYVFVWFGVFFLHWKNFVILLKG